MKDRMFVRSILRQQVLLPLVILLVLLVACQQSHPAEVVAETAAEQTVVGKLSDAVEGELSEDDEIFADRYADRYDLDLARFEEAGEALIVMHSDTFVPHFYLLDAKTGTVLTESSKEPLGKGADYGPGGTAHLRTKVSLTGNYEIIATSEIKALGRYRLLFCGLRPQIVTTTADSGPGSLREAAARVAPRGTICFDPDVFNETASEGAKTIVLESEIVLDKDLFVNGPGPEAVTISGNHHTRLFRIPEGVNITLQGIRISGGRSVGGSGGGILNGGALTVNSSVLENSHAYYGGAIHSFGPLVIINSTIKDSSAVDGGGIHVSYSSLSIDADSEVQGNQARQRGGGIFYRGTNLSLGGTVSFNTATEGGGLYLTRGNAPNLSSIDGNLAGSFYANSATRGGAIYFSGSNRSSPELFFYGSVNGNMASERGGGIYKADGSLILWDSHVSMNEAAFGGGIYSEYGSLTLQGRTLVLSNTAHDQGGGIYIFEGWGIHTGSINIYDSSSLLSNIAANRGGGVYNNRGTLVVEYSARNPGYPVAISSNLASYGGGVYNLGNVILRTDNAIWSNGAWRDGGGIYNLGSVTLESGHIVDNRACSNGGGVYNAPSGSVTLQTNSSIRDNRANRQNVEPYACAGASLGTGGGIYNDRGMLSGTLAGGSVRNNTPNDVHNVP